MKHNKTNNTNIAATLAAAIIMIFALLLVPTAARAQTVDTVPLPACSLLQTTIDGYATAPRDRIITVDLDCLINNNELIVPTPYANVTLTIKSLSTTRVLTRDVNNKNLFVVRGGANLIFENIIIDGNKNIAPYTTNTSPLISIEAGGAVTMKSGSVLRNNRATSGGGVYIDGGIFTMGGGEISNNTSTRNGQYGGYGGGIYVGQYATLIMTGGKISNNTSTDSNTNGGGVFVYGGTFTMTGGEISNNTSSGSYADGGGVYVYDDGTFNFGGDAVISDNNAYGVAVEASYFGSSTFTMSGGEIRNNIGGGVLVGPNSTFTMDGGEINGNTATGYGGGVNVSGADSSFKMNGGKISNNTATAGNGGGVYFDGTNRSAFTMNGGEISGNTATGNGGGVYGYSSYGTITINDGEISGNNANNGGGMYFTYGTSTINGGEINGNTATGNGGGVYVGGSVTFTLGGATVINDNISNNVYLQEKSTPFSEDTQIRISTTNPPVSGMKIGVQTETASGVIVQSPGASKKIEAYFHADEPCKSVIFETGQLKIKDFSPYCAINTTPLLIEFGAVYPTYTQPPAQTVTIKNTGASTVTLEPPVYSNLVTDYVIGDLSTTTLTSSGGEATFTVRPKAGLAIGTYDERIFIKNSSGTPIAALDVGFTVKYPSTISASPSSNSFGSLQMSYTQPATRTVTITNTSPGSVTLVQPSVTNAVTNYTISALSTTTLSAINSTATFTVRPKPDLPVGTYNETLTISPTLTIGGVHRP